MRGAGSSYSSCVSLDCVCVCVHVHFNEKGQSLRIMAECHMSHASDVYTCCEAAGSKILGLLDKKGAEDIIWGHVNLRAIKRPTRQRERERERVCSS